MASNHLLLEFEALGTFWSIKIPQTTQNKLALASVKKLILDFDQTYSRFSQTSLVQKLNSGESIKNPSPELVSMLNYALKIYELSDSIFDISIGADLEKNGYGLNSGSARSKDLKSDIFISETEVYLKNNVHIDLGGFGKGWLIDKVAQSLQASGIKDLVINGGGDIWVGQAPENIAVSNPLNNQETIGTVRIANSSIAASSNLCRTWVSKGHKHTHIPDATSKEILSIHVIAPSALLADTLATIFMIVSHQTRLRLAHQFGAEFMEVKSGLKIYRSSGFMLA